MTEQMTRLLSIGGSLVILLFLAVTRPIPAEGGCSRFGHSCFGAHGKRAEGPWSLETSDPLPLRTDYDRSSMGSEKGLFNPTDLRMSPFLREWILAAEREPSKEGADMRRK